MVVADIYLHVRFIEAIADRALLLAENEFIVRWGEKKQKKNNPIAVHLRGHVRPLVRHLTPLAAASSHQSATYTPLAG